MSRLVVLVEDNASDEKLTVLAFRGCSVPHELVVLRDGVEAVRYLCGDDGAERAAPPALVLLDLMLPRIDGFEVLRRLRADTRLCATSAIVLSASREREDVERCYALGANAYVQKPVDFLEFKQAIAAIGEFWLRFNQGPTSVQT
jgi:two-component system response regulator